MWMLFLKNKQGWSQYSAGVTANFSDGTITYLENPEFLETTPAGLALLQASDG